MAGLHLPRAIVMRLHVHQVDIVILILNRWTEFGSVVQAATFITRTSRIYILVRVYETEISKRLLFFHTSPIVLHEIHTQMTYSGIHFKFKDSKKVNYKHLVVLNVAEHY